MRRAEAFYIFGYRHWRSLLIIGCIFFCYTLFSTEEDKSSEMESNTKIKKYAEPNQTRWLELFKLPPKMINFTDPQVSAKAKMIVVVPIQPYMAQRRVEIRESWANVSNSDAIRNGLVSVLFAVNLDNYTFHLIKEEHRKYGDILVVRGEESYKGLVYKLLLIYKWLTKYYPRVDVAKVDSDVVMDVDKLYRVVNKQVHYHRFILGHMWKGAGTNRDPSHQWYIPATSYSPEVLPQYSNGAFYVFSASALKAVLLEAPHHRVFEVEDIFFTGVLADAASVKKIHHQGINHHRPNSQPCEDGKPTIIGYPTHYLRIDLRVEYEKMKTIRCQTFWEWIFD